MEPSTEVEGREGKLSAGFDLTETGVTLSGGVPGHVYSIVNRVTLSDGRSDDRSITLRVEER